MTKWSVWSTRGPVANAPNNVTTFGDMRNLRRTWSSKFNSPIVCLTALIATGRPVFATVAL
eukprot:CAMPEP_0198598188 /NCGR_PEP_ID=MMETSP1462-20131121/145343_1 /TAXON_ID=1333877 /ORGANISM="Brandtodinium nutriculum, Strain RCC3387" /LENGTH=60 /DNA_ID=CAMNT_0044329847 /DNA_START=105 /DNA_END=287 /DNA_ORIENTATION=-